MKLQTINYAAEQRIKRQSADKMAERHEKRKKELQGKEQELADKYKGEASTAVEHISEDCGRMGSKTP